MAEKKYFWLKLKDDFFDSIRIKKLRTLAGGDTFTIIYLKMLTKAMKNNGVLQYQGIENNLCNEIALDINESPDNVEVTLKYLLSCGLAEQIGNDCMLEEAITCVGSEQSSAERVRKYREKQKSLQCNADVTPLLQDGNTEKEIEIDKEIDKEKEKDLSLSDDNDYRTEVRRILQAWNEIGVSPVVKCTPGSKRYKLLVARLKEYSVEEILQAINEVKMSSFLQGAGKFIIDFEWFVKPNNFPKVLEGKYRDRDDQGNGHRTYMDRIDNRMADIDRMFDNIEVISGGVEYEDLPF